MKRSKRAFFAVAFACIAAVPLAGCSLFAYKPDGNTPYDIAVEEGYTGSEAEWLSQSEEPATVYRRLYEEAVADGSFSGTYYDFLCGIGVTNDDTPYIQRALLSVVSIVCRFTVENTVVSSSGAGVIISLDKAAGDAFVLTNYHVLYNSTAGLRAREANVYLYGSEITDMAIKSVYYGGAMEYDLALLHIENSETLRESAALEATRGDSGALMAGEKVYAIGNPLNKNLSVTGGVVSVESEEVTLKAANEATTIVLPEIRVDASINHGNSGGGLFNAAGELVGITNARDERDGVLGFGYAIPGNYALAIADNMLANGGELILLQDGMDVAVEESHAAYDEALGRTHISEKLNVTAIRPGAGAAQVKRGDTLVSGHYERGGEALGETQFTRLIAWETFLMQARRNDVLVLTVSRQGEAKTLRLSLSSVWFETITG